MAPLKSFILVDFNPRNITSPMNPSTSIVSPTEYLFSTIIEIPAIMSLAKSWKAKPIITVPIPNPAKIDFTFTPNTEAIAKTTKKQSIYFTIFNIKILIVFNFFFLSYFFFLFIIFFFTC